MVRVFGKMQMSLNTVQSEQIARGREEPGVAPSAHIGQSIAGDYSAWAA